MRGSSDQQALLEFDLRHGEIIFDRSKSGNKSAKVSRCQLESCSNHQLFVRILMDSISIEGITDGGRTIMTNNLFSDPSSNNLSIYTRDGRAIFRSLQTYGIGSVISD